MLKDMHTILKSFFWTVVRSLYELVTQKSPPTVGPTVSDEELSPLFCAIIYFKVNEEFKWDFSNLSLITQVQLQSFLVENSGFMLQTLHSNQTEASVLR